MSSTYDFPTLLAILTLRPRSLIIIASFSGGVVVSTTNPLSYSRAIEIRFLVIYGTYNTFVRIMLLVCLLILTDILTRPRLILGSINPFIAVIGCPIPSIVYLINAFRLGVIWLVAPKSTSHSYPLRTLSNAR